MLLGVDHFWGGMSDFEKNILQACLYQTKFMLTTTAEQKFTHVQWAEKSLLYGENHKHWPISHIDKPHPKFGNSNFEKKVLKEIN